MATLRNLVGRGLESSSGETAEWKSVFTKTKNYITKVLKANGCTEIKLNKGHFAMSGFFTNSQGKIYYISLQDFRDFGGIDRMLIRTAESYKDFRGGSNEYIQLNDFDEKIKRYC